MGIALITAAGLALAWLHHASAGAPEADQAPELDRIAIPDDLWAAFDASQHTRQREA